jgi:hypothetical protein
VNAEGQGFNHGFHGLTRIKAKRVGHKKHKKHKNYLGFTEGNEVNEESDFNQGISQEVVESAGTRPTRLKCSSFIFQCSLFISVGQMNNEQ